MRMLHLASIAVVVLLTSQAMGSQHSTGHPGLFLAPTYLGKAATVPSAAMKASLRAYTHAAQPGTGIPAATQCNIKHELLSVSSFDFSDVSVTATNATHVQVVIRGATPLVTSVGGFQVQCNYGGAFAGTLELPQSGNIYFTVDLGSVFQYDTTFLVGTDGTVTLAEPALVHNVKATATYNYTTSPAQGFALDVFVASFFETVVGPEIERELTQSVLTYPAPFAKAWFETAQEALSVTEFVCATQFLPESSSSVFWMQPGCGPDPVPFNNHTDLLKTNDILMLLPSTNGVVAQSTKGSHFKLLGANHAQQTTELLAAQVEGSSAVSSCSPVSGCNFLVNTSSPSLRVAFQNCTVCYPEGGRYTELAAIATFNT